MQPMGHKQKLLDGFFKKILLALPFVFLPLPGMPVGWLELEQPSWIMRPQERNSHAGEGGAER